MKAGKIVETIMEEKNVSKAQLGRILGVVTPEEEKEKPNKSSDVIGKRIKQNNISVNMLGEMLGAMGYTIVIAPAGQKLRDGEFEVTANE